MEEETLYLQLHKLSMINSEELLDNILTTLWKTRRTGLRSPEKSHVQSLLNLPSFGEVDPVLACLRSLIRKCVHENFTADDILKLFPADLSLDLQSTLVLLLQKYQNLWKEEISREQQPLPRTNLSYQVKTSVPPSFTSLPSSDIPTSLWPHQDDPTSRFIHYVRGIPTPITDSTASQFAAIPLPADIGSFDDLAIIPRLKSMTWTMENRNSSPSNRVAVVTLKLQDYAKSSLGETEVKFKLSRDTLEAMIRSLTYISEQLSSMVGTSTGPVQKKQRQ
ncbi:Far1-related sequence 3 [Tripterygium wilfordii]|uniref:Far1-related sequence 3 n=1 Tax=Tripterygium wilfordii TaxID=458696 RepID=A0A7J7DSL4_TRIWF|nr:uncharacterized protein LOC119996459 isoform X2 [Tripterygium wilfordii]KAF5749134.1 Far1-related sequence 3 [Tripterygium wilfordii]